MMSISTSNRGGMKLFYMNRIYSHNNSSKLDNLNVTRHYFLCATCRRGRVSCDTSTVDGEYDNYQEKGTVVIINYYFLMIINCITWNIGNT